MKESLYRLSLSTMPEGEDKESYRRWIEEHEERCRKIVKRHAIKKSKK